jgi:histidinol-phosphate aminotransferase
MTNFVLFDFGDPVRAKRAVDDLLQRGIHVRKPPHPPLDRYVRISVGSPPERAELASALRAVTFELPALRE